MKKLIFIVFIMLFSCLQAIAAPKKPVPKFTDYSGTVRLPEYSIESGTPVYAVIQYVIGQCHEKGITTPKDMPFTVRIKKQEDDSYFMCVEKSISERLVHGKYCGYFVVDELKFFIRGNDIKIFSKVNTLLTKLHYFTKVTINNPVPDGIGPTWNFIFKDGKIYKARLATDKDE